MENVAKRNMREGEVRRKKKRASQIKKKVSTLLTNFKQNAWRLFMLNSFKNIQSKINKKICIIT